MELSWLKVLNIKCFKKSMFQRDSRPENSNTKKLE